MNKFDYKVENLSISFITGKHFTYEGINDYIDLDEVLFTFQLSYKGYYFLEKNSITIGVNPNNKEITTIKSNILALEIGNNFNNIDIDYDFSLLKETDEIAYHKFYIKIEDGSYHISIISIDRLTSEVKIVKIY